MRVTQADRAYRLRERDGLVAEVVALARDYISGAAGGYGIAEQAGQLHRAIDQLTSNVYDSEFAYCGREHSVA